VIRLEKRKVTLYVKSVKELVGTEKDGTWRFRVGAGIRGGYRLIRDYDVLTIGTYESVLPNDQKIIVEMVEAIADRHGFEVKIVDVTMESMLHRISEKLLRINAFPALITDSGEKIEGNISEEQVESLLEKVALTKSR
jgi:hypothetical protein